MPRRLLRLALPGVLLPALLMAAATPAAGQIDLVLNMADTPDPVAAGGRVSYVATVANDGLATATGVTFQFDLPAATSYEGFTGPEVNCSGMPLGTAGPGQIVCELPDLPFLADVGFTIEIGTTTAGVVAVRGEVWGDQPDDQPDNGVVEELTTVVAGANVSIDLGGPATAAAGSTAHFDITVSNAGPDPASSLVVEVPIPTGLVVTGPAPAGCTLATLHLRCVVSGTILPGADRAIGTLVGQISAASGSTLTTSGSVILAPGAPIDAPRDPDTGDNSDVVHT